MTSDFHLQLLRDKIHSVFKALIMSETPDPLRPFVAAKIIEARPNPVLEIRKARVLVRDAFLLLAAIPVMVGVIIACIVYGVLPLNRGAIVRRAEDPGFFWFAAIVWVYILGVCTFVFWRILNWLFKHFRKGA